MEPRRLIIDTDGGIDDAAAIWWALNDPRIDLVAVTAVAGVLPAAAAARNVRRLLLAAGRGDVPVGVGDDERMGPVPSLPSTDFIHGADGLGNTTANDDRTPELPGRGAVELLHDLCARNPGAISVVSIGPLTNFARTIQRYPHWAATVRDYVAMAGSATVGGNALPAAEFNVAADPVAAAIVVAASWRSPPLMVGLDATHAATLTEREFALLQQRRTPAAAYLDAPLRFYRRFGSTFTAPDCPCHDLLAVMALVEPDLVTSAPLLPLAVETSTGPAQGATVVDFRAPVFERAGVTPVRSQGFHPWRIALRVDTARFRHLVTTWMGGA